jgi:putative addiction module component (TIGR02574 family)
MQTAEIISAAIQLSPADRFVLVERILQTLDQPDPSIDELWQLEAERRWQSLQNGTTQSIPADQVLSALKL